MPATAPNSNHFERRISMWSRAELKFYAKAVLRKHYWWAILAFLIYYAISIIATAPFSILNTIIQLPKQMEAIKNGDMIGNYTAAYNPIFSILIFAVSFFVFYPLLVGLYKFFLNIRENRTNLTDIFLSFKNGNYLSVVGSMAWMYLFTFLWTLLFIVPGIIKAISYSMTPFILADNPKIGYKRALKLSMAMTDGQKGAIFVLGLSFIGWALLGLVVCFGIGIFFLMPYFYATFTELYVKLRTNAVNNGICTPNELNLKNI